MSYMLQTDKKSIYYRKGRTQPISEIVIHHWGAEGATTFDRLVTWLSRPDQKNTSPHYVAERGRVARLVDEADTAYHAGRVANPKSIGIECRPEATDADYKTVAELISDIWKRHGKLEIKAHKDYMATGCPGKWNLAKLKTMAEAFYMPKQSIGTGTAPSGGGATGSKVIYRVRANGSQIGAYSVVDGAMAQAKTALLEGKSVEIVPAVTAPALKSYDEIAKEVISGKWGNYPERKTKLEALGYNWVKVQEAVNRLI